jgi:hypothetical protein
MTHAFLLGQVLVTLFIGLHDWVPLGRLNNLGGIRAVDPLGKRVWTTAWSVLPFAVGLGGCFYYGSGRYPQWLWWVLWVTYGLGLYGLLRAWWLPYLFGTDPARAERYKVRFAGTHAFLPERHGMRPDTLHFCFHIVLVTTMALLVARTICG